MHRETQWCNETHKLQCTECLLDTLLIHREALPTEELAEDLHAVLNDRILVVNFIKRRPLNHRLFSALCEEMGSQHTAPSTPYRSSMAFSWSCAQQYI